MTQLLLALGLTLVSACALNAGYLLEHSVASRVPKLSIRRPLASLKLLVSNRRWLMGFGTEAIGWILYVIALSLAPLSLVQATAAGGIGILALMVARITRVPLSPSERIGVAVSVAGLAALGASLAGAHGEGQMPADIAVIAWLVGSAAIALLALRLGSCAAIGGAAAFGLATGICFAAGDVATKVAVGDSLRPEFFLALVPAYAAGTVVLQAGFQRGGALTTAGIATLFTNALPIAAGMTLFREPLPSGWLGVLRLVAFVAVVGGALALARPAPQERPDDGTPDGDVGLLPARELV